MVDCAIIDDVDFAVGASPNMVPVRRRLIVLIGGDLATIDRARGLDYEVFLVLKSANFDPAMAARCAGILLVDFTEFSALQGLIAALGESFELCGVVSLTELGLLPASRLREHLGLPGVSSRAVMLTRDKELMREAVAGIQLLPARVVRDAAEAARFAEIAGWPLILKPQDGFGSRRVSLAPDEAALQAVDFRSGLLAERYVRGRLVSVEAFSLCGQHRIYAINEEFPIGEAAPPGGNPYVEVAHQLPAQVSGEQALALHMLLPLLLDAMGITDGASHSEFILGPDGPVLIESHTRVGGDFIPEMIQRCTGVDLLGLSLANPTDAVLPLEPAWQRGAALRFFTAKPGTVAEVHGVEACEDMPGVAAIRLRVKPGDQVVPLLYAADRLGYVMAIAEDSAAAMQICDAVMQRVKITMEADAV